MIYRKDVSFKTVDGLTLRGWLYPVEDAGGRAPAVVVTPGFNCVKEMFIPQVGEYFQSAGIAALLYDPRTLGDSEGLPRNHIDPNLQLSDYSDALSFLLTQPDIDPERIAFWGMSFSATIAMCAAAMDTRAKLCIAICPLLDFTFPLTLSRVLASSMKDRLSQTLGNAPSFIPVLTADGKNPAGLGFQTTTEELDYMMNAKSRGAPNYENKTTLQSYYKLAVWQPHAIINVMNQKGMGSTKVCMVVPELDQISPPEKQFELFNTLPEGKESHVAPGKGHLDVLSGEGFEHLMGVQADFLKNKWLEA
ncbi:Alpha/Beta hydrolase protein [Lophiotrema nucula]|uniref:Alpha/Beta hydrolase protein n=1 Tax=Lophiotrema nucula TaxID=690887 RepID=A0A6A5ZJ26_9PLEO|nr:Alpha/Beta hydrolase protein [Lophiotrema nucula]